MVTLVSCALRSTTGNRTHENSGKEGEQSPCDSSKSSPLTDSEPIDHPTTIMSSVELVHAMADGIVHANDEAVERSQGFRFRLSIQHLQQDGRNEGDYESTSHALSLF